MTSYNKKGAGCKCRYYSRCVGKEKKKSQHKRQHIATRCCRESLCCAFEWNKWVSFHPAAVWLLTSPHWRPLSLGPLRLAKIPYIALRFRGVQLQTAVFIYLFISSVVFVFNRNYFHSSQTAKSFPSCRIPRTLGGEDPEKLYCLTTRRIYTPCVGYTPTITGTTFFIFF